MALSSKKVVISSDGLDWTTHHQTLDHHQFPKQQQPLIRRQHQQQNQPEQLKCPRCDSSNTKFCYYNNYNKTQPRHFCKSCKRHWTKGGTLRNVPVGAGRKNKTHKSSKTTTVVTTAAAATRSTNHNVSLLNRVNSHPPLPIGGQKNLSEILYRAGLITPASASSSSSSSALQQNCVSNNSNGVLFGSNLSLPQSQSHDQGLNFSYPNPFQSSNFSDYTGEPLEDSTITTTSSTITLPWQTSTTDFWNWDDIDNLVSTTDLNIPWNDDPEIKP